MDLRESQRTPDKSAARHPWELARFEVLYSLIKENMPQIPGKTNVIFDIGCGDTFFIENLAGRLPACRFIAVDPALNKDMVRMYSSKLAPLHIKVFDSWEKAAQTTADKADIVLLLDVIEHIADDISFLKSLRANPGITDNTLFVITVPAFQALFCSRDRFLGHKRRYNNRQLKNSIEQAGFKEISSGYFFFSLLPVRLLQVIIAKMFPGGTGADKGIGNWKGNRIMDVILKNLLVTDFKIASFLRSKTIQSGRTFNLYGMQKICIVIPCYNEGDRLPVKEFNNFLTASDSVFFYFVNDGSNDNTSEILNSLHGNWSEKTMVLNLPCNCGKAEAVRRGSAGNTKMAGLRLCGIFRCRSLHPIVRDPVSA